MGADVVWLLSEGVYVTAVRVVSCELFLHLAALPLSQCLLQLRVRVLG